jgi:hypothetical protein
VLARVYESVMSSDLERIDFLKRTALQAVREILDSANSLDSPTLERKSSILQLLKTYSDLWVSGFLFPQALNCSEIELDVPTCFSTISQLLTDDLSLLRRLSRVERCVGVDFKAVLLSGKFRFVNFYQIFLTFPLSTFCAGFLYGNIFAAGLTVVDEVSPVVEIVEKKLRLQALKSICPLLQMQTIMPWNRAVGRILDVGPSQLHFLYALHRFREYAQFSRETSASFEHEVQLSNLSAVLSEVLIKLRPEFLRVLSLLILGLSFDGIKKMHLWSGVLLDSIAYQEKDSFFMAIPTSALLVSDVTVLLSGMHSAIKQNKVEGVEMFSGGTKNESIDQNIEISSDSFVQCVMTFHNGLQCLSEGERKEFLQFHFGDKDKSQKYFCSLLRSEDTEVRNVSAAFDTFFIHHSALCNMCYGCSKISIVDHCSENLSLIKTMKLAWRDELDRTVSLFPMDKSCSEAFTSWFKSQAIAFRALSRHIYFTCTSISDTAECIRLIEYAVECVLTVLSTTIVRTGDNSAFGGVTRLAEFHLDSEDAWIREIVSECESQCYSGLHLCLSMGVFIFSTLIQQLSSFPGINHQLNFVLRARSNFLSRLLLPSSKEIDGKFPSSSAWCNNAAVVPVFRSELRLLMVAFDSQPVNRVVLAQKTLGLMLLLRLLRLHFEYDKLLIDSSSGTCDNWKSLNYPLNLQFLMSLNWGQRSFSIIESISSSLVCQFFGEGNLHCSLLQLAINAQLFERAVEYVMVDISAMLLQNVHADTGIRISEVLNQIPHDNDCFLRVTSLF